MVEEDIVGSIGWSKAISDVGILTADEQKRLEQALNELLAEVRAKPEIVAASGEEDVHSFVEASLIRKVGDLGKKLHTGRSRKLSWSVRLSLRQGASRMLCSPAIPISRGLSLSLSLTGPLPMQRCLTVII